MKNTIGRYLGKSTVWAGLAITLAVALMIEGSALPSTMWPNEPAGFNLITDWAWSALSGGGWDHVFDVDTGIVSDGTAPLSPSNVMTDHFAWPNGGSGGGSKHYYSLSPRLTEGYVGHYWKINSGFVPYGSCFEKGFQQRMDGGAFWVQLNGCPGGATVNLIVSLSFNNPNLDECNLPNSWGDCPGNRHIAATAGVNATFSKGVWHRVELYYKYSTCSTCFNGIIKVWLDGVQTHNLTTVNFPPLTDGVWESVITPAWGDSSSGTSEKAHYWDHSHISSPTGSGPAPDTTPPLSPTGLRVQ